MTSLDPHDLGNSVWPLLPTARQGAASISRKPVAAPTFSTRESLPIHGNLTPGKAHALSGAFSRVWRKFTIWAWCRI